MKEIVFINYRRNDAQAAAGRLNDQLEAVFPPECIFYDVDSILPGREFPAELAERVGQCDIFLAIIGRSWADVVDSGGDRRLDDPNDWVRVEIESALRLGKQIVPVLVDGADMPRPETLPECLRPLTRRNAVRLTHERFRADVQGLVAAIGKMREISRAAHSSERRCYVSYAWADKNDPTREQKVDALCEDARSHGIEIFRDKTTLGRGDLISEFMRKIEEGDRVFIFLSDKYLHSPYCMFELFEMWRTAVRTRRNSFAASVSSLLTA